MLAKTHKFVETAMHDLGPVLHATQHDYDTILQGMSLIMARIIQATPQTGDETQVKDQAFHYITQALEQFIQLEQEAVNAKAAERDRLRTAIEKSINGFGKQFDAPSLEDENDVASAIEESFNPDGPRSYTK